jgi:UDP-N-acetylglucosamine--N-acetylmuramyl-(pentapeptide) pyrophosphoryl-undecaprenol N-acetylglucosamine transferase
VSTEQSAKRDVRRFAFAGGGSGGHVVPCLAVSEEIRRCVPDSRLLFLISQRPVDRLIMNQAAFVADESVEVVPVDASPAGKFLKRPWSFFSELVRSIRHCRRLFQQHVPDAVFATGGFVSVPAVIAAVSLRIPVVLYEANSVPGRANLFLSRFAEVVCTGFPMTAADIRRLKTQVIPTGIPVRSEFQQDRPQLRESGESSLLLVFGGSQGAASINSMICGILESPDGSSVIPTSWRIILQSGNLDFENTAQRAKLLKRDIQVVALLDNPGELLSQAELVVTRCGAGVLGELSAIGVAAVLVPLIPSAGQHQLRNAEFLEEKIPGIMIRADIPEAVERLKDRLRVLTTDRPLRAHLAGELKAIHGSNAVQKIAEIILKCRPAKDAEARRADDEKLNA